MHHLFRHPLSLPVGLLALIALTDANPNVFAQSGPAERRLEIVLNSTGTFVNGKPMNAAQLEADIRTMAPPPVVAVRADQNVDYRDVVALLEALQRAGATKIALETRDPAGGLNIDFPGGTVAQLIELLKTTGQSFNLLTEKEYLSQSLPPFSVRNADPYLLADSLNRILRPHGLVIGRTARPGNPPTSSPVFYIESVKTEEAATRAGDFKCYALHELLDRYTPDQIAGALRTAWELDPANDPKALQIKFHPETGLLFVVGPQRDGRAPGAIEVADQVIRHLLPPPPKPSPESAEPTSSPSR